MWWNDNKSSSIQSETTSHQTHLIMYVAITGVAPDGEVGVAENEAVLGVQAVQQHVLVDEATAVNLWQWREEFNSAEA